MGASSYQRDRKRVYQEAEGRGRGFKKAALKRLDKEYGAETIRRGGKVVGIRLDDDSVICKKKSFATREAALDAMMQIAHFRDTGHAKPQRAYSCPFCGQFHVTKKTSAGQPADIDVDE